MSRAFDQSHKENAQGIQSIRVKMIPAKTKMGYDKRTYFPIEICSEIFSGPMPLLKLTTKSPFNKWKIIIPVSIRTHGNRPVISIIFSKVKEDNLFILSVLFLIGDMTSKLSGAAKLCPVHQGCTLRLC